MAGHFDLSADQRSAVLDLYRADPDPDVRFRAHILLLLADGHTWATVAAFLYCSSRTIDRWVKRFHSHGIEGLAGRKPGRPFRFDLSFALIAVNWVTQQTPRDFGFFRSRWCCETLSLLFQRLHRLKVSRETVRRWLRCQGLVYRRPRPVVGPIDEQRPAKLDELRQLMDNLPDDETVVFQDEADINTNPKIGSIRCG